MCTCVHACMRACMCTHVCVCAYTHMCKFALFLHTLYPFLPPSFSFSPSLSSSLPPSLPPSLSPLLTEGQWSSLPPHKKREKEAFLASEKRASRGFISQANKQMELLDILSEMGQVAQCLCQPPLARRTAAAVSGRYCSLSFLYRLPSFVHTLPSLPPSHPPTLPPPSPTLPLLSFFHPTSSSPSCLSLSPSLLSLPPPPLPRCWVS